MDKRIRAGKEREREREREKEINRGGKTLCSPGCRGSDKMDPRQQSQQMNKVQ